LFFESLLKQFGQSKSAPVEAGNSKCMMRVNVYKTSLWGLLQSRQINEIKTV